MNRTNPTLALSFLVLVHCVHAPPRPEGEPVESSPTFGDWGVQTEHMSTTIKPGDDFYRYVNEGWLQSTTLPPGRPLFSAPWAVQAKVNAQIEDLLTEAAATEAPKGTAERRVGDLYRSFMNTAEIERRGLSVLADDLKRIRAIETHEAVATWMANPRSSALFHLRVQPPVSMQGSYVLTIAQYRTTGLGLSGQVYYKSDETRYAEHRAAYLQYIALMLERAGFDRPAVRAADVLALERAFANIMWDFAKLREAGASFRLIETSDLATIAPGFPWAEFLRARGLNHLTQVNLGVGAIAPTAALFRRFAVESWRSYLAFHWLNNHASVLPEPFGQARFDFYDRRLLGVNRRKPRSERVVQFVERALGDDVGGLFVDRYFPAAYKEKVEQVITYVSRAFRERLATADWMDEPTRQEAMAKLEAIVVEIAEPGKSHDWSGLVTDATNLVGNYARLKDYAWQLQRARIGQPISRLGDWNMYPHRIGAGYHQQYNKIFLTAGALQPPFFDPHADAAVNFGSLGQTIGHEFGHALDDQGSQFDRTGALRNWWTPTSRRAYEERTTALIEQYNRYAPVPGANLAAKQMIGEIVGDLTGTSVAFRAYELYAADHPEEAKRTLGGFSGAQRFFLATAQQSRTIATEAAMRDIALHESHPPAEFRINGVVRNVAAWYRAFSVDTDAALFLPQQQRVLLW